MIVFTSRRMWVIYLSFFWLLFFVAEISSQEKKALSGKEGESNALKADPRLAVRIKANFKQPKVEEVMKALENITGLKMTCNDQVELTQEAFGSLSFWNAPAWLIMTQLAKSKAVKGSWEKTDDGYRLLGTLTKQAQELRLFQMGKEVPVSESYRFGIYLATAVLLVLVSITGLFLFFKGRHRRQIGRLAVEPSISEPTASPSN